MILGYLGMNAMMSGLCFKIMWDGRRWGYRRANWPCLSYRCIWVIGIWSSLYNLSTYVSVGNFPSEKFRKQREKTDDKFVEIFSSYVTDTGLIWLTYGVARNLALREVTTQ